MTSDSNPDPSYLDPASRRVGTVLDGKWKLDHLLGVGGMAAVYAATHRNGARAAIKLFPFSVTTSAEFAERILREGYLANKIGHPAIVRVLDDHLDREREYAYLVMELLEGQTARERVERGGPMSPIEAVEFAIELSSCLAAAHDKGVVHRDIKPENLFLTDDHHLKVLDFGVARALDGTSSTVTRTGAMLGTPAYMSPEQARGRPSELSARSDIYSAGATLLFLIAGEFVHDGESAQEVMVRAAWTPPQKMQDRGLGIPEPIARIIDRACEFEPKDRYQSATEMRADLEAARAALAVDPKSTEPIARSSKSPPRGPLMTAPLPLSRPTPQTSAEATIADRTPPPPPEGPLPFVAQGRVTAIGVAAAAAVVLVIATLIVRANRTEPPPRVEPPKAAIRQAPPPETAPSPPPAPSAAEEPPASASATAQASAEPAPPRKHTPVVHASTAHAPVARPPATSTAASLIAKGTAVAPPPPLAKTAPTPAALKPGGRDVGY